jgi:signal peptidase I
VPAHGYFALGDNSYNSYDSRYWGPVPEENLVGRGLFVYWPFNRHWGLIR